MKTPEEIIIEVLDLKGCISEENHNLTMKVGDVIKCIELAQQQVKSVDLADVVGRSEQLHKLLQYLSDEDELVGNRTHQEIIDSFNQLG
jgi:hypothetical protein